MAFRLPSVDPSSTTITSLDGQLWARALSTASAIQRSPLKQGIRIETRSDTTSLMRLEDPVDSRSRNEKAFLHALCAKLVRETLDDDLETDALESLAEVFTVNVVTVDAAGIGGAWDELCRLLAPIHPRIYNRPATRFEDPQYL